MQSVNFRCGHCGNLMAVGEEFLGQQVRCPHCEQVVATSPGEAGPGPSEGVNGAEPVPPPPDDLSSPPTRLFGEGPARPTMEAFPPGSSSPFVPAMGPDAAPPPEPGPASVPESPAPPTDTFAGALPSPALRQPRSRSSMWFLLLFVFPLITYSILVTIFAVLLAMQLFAVQPKSPMEEMIDPEGDFKGGTRLNQGSSRYKRPLPTEPLPDHLHVALGRPVQIGDLNVTPQKVELKQVRFRTGDKVNEGRYDSLVLTLLLKNTSTDVLFSPTDPFFDRRWKEKKGQVASGMPYTYLELKTDPPTRFYGGPVEWRPGERDREVIEDQQAGKQLRPGEELTTFVCTDPEDQAGRSFQDFHGPCVWRVHLRRGLVKVRGRDWSATAVIGVTFTDADIRGLGQGPS